MDRRMMVTLIAGATVAGPALAQMATGAMGDAEKTHAMKTGMAGTASLRMADIGLEKAHGGMVKQFAKFEHDEQTTVAEILKSIDPGMAPPQPDQKSMAAIEKLKAMKSGAEFDKAFIAGQIEGHETLLTIQEDYLKAGKDRERLNATKLVRGMVKEHLALLAELKKTA